MESYIFSTSLGKRLKVLEERIFNFEFFQYILFVALILESLFFFSEGT